MCLFGIRSPRLSWPASRCPRGNRSHIAACRPAAAAAARPPQRAPDARRDRADVLIHREQIIPLTWVAQHLASTSAASQYSHRYKPYVTEWARMNEWIVFTSCWHSTRTGQFQRGLSRQMTVRTNTKLPGPACGSTARNAHFSAAGPRVWTALPPELRHDISFGLFRRKLKSHLFV